MIFKKKIKHIDASEFSLSKAIEFTLLDPRATFQDIHTLINVAVKHNYYGVCLSPCFVKEARCYIDEKLKSDINVITTIGFPLGTATTQTKVDEAKQAINDGADELDVVINIGKVKDSDFAYVKEELSRIVRISKGKIIKAIIETCYLNKEEIKNVCKVCEKAKVDFIKTSTGFGTGGATIEDITTIKEVVKHKLGIKASGGIKTRVQAEELIRAGANRIGTSRIL